MKQYVIGALAATIAGLGLATTDFHARFSPSPIDAPSLVEEAQCRTVRERIRRPNGRVVFRTSRRCGPRFGVGPRCRTVRERVVRPKRPVVVRLMRRSR